MIYDKLAQVESKLASLEVKLGLPQRKNLLIRKRKLNNVTKLLEITDILLNPKPHVTSVSPKYQNLQISIEGADSIFITASDYQVEIPRTVNKSLFEPVQGETVRCLLEPPLNELGQIIYTDELNKEIEAAKWCNIVFIDDNHPTVWKLIITKNFD